MIALDVVLAVLRRFWREAVVVLVVLTAWGWISVERAARGRAEGREAEAITRALVAEQAAAACTTALDDQAAGLERWKQEAEEQQGRVEAVNVELRQLRERHAHEAGLLEGEIARLHQILAETPEPDRCEAAARWAVGRYLEVTRATP